MRPIDKTIKELQEKGYATLKTDGHNDSEVPDVWPLVNVWFGVGQKSLYLDYEWRRDKYHFYFYKNRKEAVANRPKTLGPLDVYHVETYLKKQMPYFSMAKKVARTLDGKKGYYLTANPNVMDAITDDENGFPGLVNWFVKNLELSIVFAEDDEKPMYIIGDYIKVEKKLKRLGYKTHMIDEDWEEFDDIELVFI